MPRLLVSVISMMLLFSFSVFAAEQTLPPDSAQTLRSAILAGGSPTGLKLDSIVVEQTSAVLRFAAGGKTYTATLTFPSGKGDSRLAGPFAVALTPDPGDWPKSSLETLTTRLRKVAPDIWRAPGTGKDPSWMVKDLVLSAEQLLDRDEVMLASRLLNIARHLDPKNADLGWAQVRLYAQTGDGEASRQAALAQPLTPDSEVHSALEAVRRIVFSDLNLSEGDALQGLAVLSPEKRSGDEHDPACEVEKMAVVLDLRGKQERAAELRMALVKSAPQCTMAWSSLGRYMLDQGKAKEFLDLVNVALVNYPEEPELITQQARALRRQLRLKDSMVSYEKLYALTHDESVISLYSSIASQNPGDDPTYNEIVKKSEEDPDNLLYRHAWGVLAHYRHDYPTSVRIMDELRPKLPTNARMFIYGAMSRYQLGDWDGALSWLRDLEKIGTADPDLWYCLSVLYHKRDKELSLKYLDKYLAIPPDPDEYQPKRQRAINFRGLVENGERVEDWEPQAVPGQGSGCASPNATSGWLLTAVWGILIARRIKRLKVA
jgi:tetratricopeptide (TPR) repeat protein